MNRTNTGLFMDFWLSLNNRKSHVVLTHAFDGQANFSGAAQMIHHSEDLIPRDIRTPIKQLFQQKAGLIGESREYSMGDVALSSHVYHGLAPFLRHTSRPALEKLQWCAFAKTAFTSAKAECRCRLRHALGSHPA